MFKKLVLAIFLVGLIAIAGSVYAGEPVINHLADALTGHNDYIATNMYVAKTISLENMPYAKMLNADLRIKASTPIGDNCFQKGIIEIGLEF